MKPRHVFADRSTYKLYRSSEFMRAIQKDYDHLYDTETPEFADNWYRKIYEFQLSLANPDPLNKRLGTIDGDHYSKTYAHRHVPDTEETIFFKVEGDTIFLVTAGWSRLDWPKLFKERQAQIAASLGHARDNEAVGISSPIHPAGGQITAGNIDPDDAGAVLDEPAPSSDRSESGKSAAPRKPDDDRGDID